MDDNLINQLIALPGEELHLKKGDFLFHEGDKAEHFYVVLKGRMSIKKMCIRDRLVAWYRQKDI